MYMEQNKTRKPTNDTNPYISALVGGGISLAMMLLTALVFPMISLKLNDPNALTALSAYLCLFLGALVGSFAASRRDGKSHIAVAMMSGGVMLATMLLVSLIIPGGIGFASAAAALAVVAVASFVGGMAAQKLDIGRKRSMKRVMKRR